MEIAPLGRYAWPVKEKLNHDYIHSNKTGLKKVISAYKGKVPAVSNLHRWSVQLGKRAVALTPSNSIPMSFILQKTSEKKNHGVIKFWDNQKFEVAPFKYKTEKRKEELEAVFKLLETAKYLFPDQKYPLTAWEEWLQSQFHVPCLSVQGKNPRTLMQLPPPTKNLIQDQKHKKTQKKGKNYGSRSPPNRIVSF